MSYFLRDELYCFVTTSYVHRIVVGVVLYSCLRFKSFRWTFDRGLYFEILIKASFRAAVVFVDLVDFVFHGNCVVIQAKTTHMDSN